MDTTGAQYGYANPLCPWHDFEQHRSGKVNRECEFGYIRHHVYLSYGMFPVRHMVASTIEKQELTKLLEEKIPALAREHGGNAFADAVADDAEIQWTSVAQIWNLHSKPRLLNPLNFRSPAVCCCLCCCLIAASHSSPSSRR